MCDRFEHSHNVDHFCRLHFKGDNFQTLRKINVSFDASGSDIWPSKCPPCILRPLEGSFGDKDLVEIQIG